MQRWEYLQVCVSANRWIDSAGRQGEVPQLLAAAYSVGNTGSLLSELGEQGWELTGVASDDRSFYQLFLKRPRP